MPNIRKIIRYWKAYRAFKKILKEVKKVKISNKLKSRKFLMAVGTAILLVLNKGLELNIPEDTMMKVMAVVITFILGESAADAAGAAKNNKKKK